MDKSQNQYAEWKKPEIKKINNEWYHLHDILEDAKQMHSNRN